MGHGPGKTATTIGVLLMLLWAPVVMAYDVWLYASGYTTISETALAMGGDYPILTLAFGLVVGGLATHLYMPQIRYREPEPVPSPPVIVVVAPPKEEARP